MPTNSISKEEIIKEMKKLIEKATEDDSVWRISNYYLKAITLGIIKLLEEN